MEKWIQSLWPRGESWNLKNTGSLRAEEKQETRLRGASEFREQAGKGSEKEHSSQRDRFQSGPASTTLRLASHRTHHTQGRPHRPRQPSLCLRILQHNPRCSCLLSRHMRASAHDSSLKVTTCSVGDNSINSKEEFSLWVQRNLRRKCYQSFNVYLLLSFKKKWSSDRGYTVDAPCKHFAKLNKPDTKGQTLYDFSWMGFLQWPNS